MKDIIFPFYQKTIVEYSESQDSSLRAQKKGYSPSGRLLTAMSTVYLNYSDHLHVDFMYRRAILCTFQIAVDRILRVGGREGEGILYGYSWNFKTTTSRTI
jgi:hypothetical protein